MKTKFKQKFDKHPLRYRIFATLFSLLLVIGMIPVTVSGQTSESDSSNTGGIDTGMPSTFDASVNPYGYEAGVPFLLAAENELVTYISYGQDTSSPYFSNRKYADFVTGSISSGVSEGTLTSSSLSNITVGGSGFDYGYNLEASRVKKASFVQAVSFDGKGTGHKNYIAYIGYDGSSGKIITWVQDASTGSGVISNVVELDEAQWLKDDKDAGLQQYNANNFFSITAGRYSTTDTEYKETYVLYYVGDNGPQLRQFYLADEGIIEVKNSARNVYPNISEALHQDYVGSGLWEKNNDPRNQLAASLATGDFNGDSLDDLAVLSYVSKPSKDTGKMSASMFCPQMSVIYGYKTDASNYWKGLFYSSSEQSAEPIHTTLVREEVTNTKIADSKLYSTFYSPSVTAGDIDGNGLDEIVIAGYAAETQTVSAASEKTKVPYTLMNTIDDTDNEKYNIVNTAVYNAGSSLTCRSFESFNLKTQYDGENGVLNLYTAATYRFFRNKLRDEPNYEYSIAPAFTVQCVAVNSSNQAEQIFLNGTMCTYDGGIQALYTPKCFNWISNVQIDISLVDFLYNNKISSNAVSPFHKGFDNSMFGINITASVHGMSFPFIQSTAVGDFSKESGLGREQIAFSVAVKVSDEDDYYYSLGMMGGCNYTDTYDENNTLTVAGTAGGQYCTLDPYDIYNDIYNKECNINKKGDNLSEKLNCLVICADTGNDGVVAKYKDAGYCYTAPEIVTVLQAAPYFAELKPYSNSNATTYSITHSYSIKTTASESASYSIGLSAEVQAPGIKTSLNAGTTHGWTKSFEEELTQSYKFTFAATTQNQIVIQRTPVFMYSYDIQDENGNWISAGETGSLQIAIPQKPIYVSMNAEEYNAYVAAYNSQKDIKTGEKLSPITDTTLLYNEGNPASYRSEWSNGSTALMTGTANALQYGNGYRSFAYAFA